MHVCDFLKALAGSALIVPLIISGPQGAAAEEKTVNAYAPISTSGYFLQTSEKSASFVGLVSGLMTIESKDGLINAGNISCTAVLTFEGESNKFTGQGDCKVLGTQGKVLYGSYQCSGERGLGCKGTFTLQGGTAEFSEASGDSDFILRSLIAESGQDVGAGLGPDAADGIALWRNLTITLPETENTQSENGKSEQQ